MTVETLLIELELLPLPPHLMLLPLPPHLMLLPLPPNLMLLPLPTHLMLLSEMILTRMASECAEQLRVMGTTLLLQAAILLQLLLLLLLLEQHPLKHLKILNAMMPTIQQQQMHIQRQRRQQQEVQGQEQGQEEVQGQPKRRRRRPDACPKHYLGGGGGVRQRAQVRGQLGGRRMLSNLPRLKPFCRVTLTCLSALLMLTLPAQPVTLTWAMVTMATVSAVILARSKQRLWVSAEILARSKQRLWQQTAVRRRPAPCRWSCERRRRRRPASKETFSSWLRNGGVTPSAFEMTRATC
jgi:hypothetical protein